jgi:thiamine monophosphate kinase
MNALYDIKMYLEQARQVIAELDEIGDDEAVIHLELSMLIMDVDLLLAKREADNPQQPLFAIKEKIKWN